MSEKPDVGIAWIEGSDFAGGTIEVDVRGKDVFQQSFAQPILRGTITPCST